MEHSVKCPSCNVELVEGDVFDTCVTDDYVKVSVAGFCPECDKDFQWVRKYNFVGVFDLKEDS